MFKRYQRATLDVVGMVNANRSVQTRLSQSIARIQRENLLAVARASLDLGMAAGRLGEISLLVTGGKLLLTMRGVWFGALTDRQLVVCGLEPNSALDTPDLPTHVEWHRTIYAATDAKAVLLMQPAGLLALGTGATRHAVSVQDDGAHVGTRYSASATLSSANFQLAWDDAGGIAFVEGDSADAIALAATAYGVVVMRGVGALAHGADGNEALAKLHSAERWAQVALFTSPLNPLSTP
jgi:ribulose-5-phosphate 4-epimerase/fuculose-1-phosphate aldolase